MLYTDCESYSLSDTTLSTMKNNIRWIIRITLLSIVISVAFTLASTEALSGAGYFAAFAILLVFILIGIIFDIIGVSVTVAPEAPFHSMASRRRRGAREAVYLLKNSEKVSSICNDVVGDIAGIVSGTTSTIIVTMLVRDFSVNNVFLQLAMSGIVSGMTIGGKAIGKIFAINNSVSVVFGVGRFVSLFTPQRGKGKKRKP